MKNLIKTSIIVVLLLMTALSSAKDIPSLRNLEDGKTTMLTLLHVKQGDQLIIKDLIGDLLIRDIAFTIHT